MAHEDPVLAFKGGVRLAVTAPAIAHLLASCDVLSERSDVRDILDGDLTVTSGNDASHLPTSRHYRNEAIDLRLHNVALDKRDWLREQLEHYLNAPFDRLYFRVLHEGIGTEQEHLHVQVRKGMNFPPAPGTPSDMT